MKTARAIRHDIEYAAVRGALALAASLPLGVARGVGASAGWLAYALGIRREVTVDNIVRALGVSRGEAGRIGCRAYQNLGRSMMEFAAFSRWSREEVLRETDIEGAEHLANARAAGRGAVIVAGHFGNWELGGTVIPALGYPNHFVVGEQSNARVDDIMNNVRRAQGSELIPRATALRKVMVALRANEFVALLADQDARKGGVIVDFLGRPASTVRGPALFAIRARCPIIPLSVHRRGKRFGVIFDPPLWPDPSLDEDQAVADLTRRHVAALAKRIREHPDEYFWPHRRWKSASAQLAKQQPVSAGN